MAFQLLNVPGGIKHYSLIGKPYLVIIASNDFSDLRVNAEISLLIVLHTFDYIYL